MSRPVALDHDQLVHLLYESVDAADGFLAPLQALSHWTDTTAGNQFLLISSETPHVETHSYTVSNKDEDGVEAYVQHWKEQDPRFATASRSPGTMLSDVTALDWETFRRSPIYNDFLLRYGVRHSLFGVLPAGPGLQVGVALMRGLQGGHFERGEVDALTPLLPHIARAARLRHLVGQMRSDLDDLRSALDAVPTPLLVLDDTARVVVTNRHAERLLRATTGLTTERGRISCRQPDEHAALTRALTQVASLADAADRTPATAAPPVTLRVSRPGASTLALALLPLRPGSPLRQHSPRRARVLAMLHDPSRRWRLQPALLQQLYGLTATEAALAVALAEGHTLADFAYERGGSEQTARTHLKRVLEKTGTRRQAELVRLLLTGIALHQGR